MPTPEEHLRQDVGALITQLLFQNAMLKADIDKMREESNSKVAEPHGDRR